MPISETAVLGEGVRILRPELVNIYGCTIGNDTTIGPFVEIQRGAVVGARCKISSHSFICEGVTLDDEVFVGHGVMFTNDLMPRATNQDGTMQGAADWRMTPTRVKRRASLGSNVTVLAGIVIGEEAMIGAGAVVTSDVPDHAIAVGNPARIVGDVRDRSPAGRS